MLQAALALWAATLCSGELAVEDSSLFAIATRKGGIARGMAHNHFIVARSWQARLEADPERLTDLTFSFSVQAENLEVDPPREAAEFFPEIRAMGVLEEPFSDVSAKDRAKIRKTMLGRKQLDAERFPDIAAKTLNVVAKQGRLGEKSFDYELQAELTIHGRTVVKTFMANIVFTEGVFRLEAAAAATFTEFGIEPYSAMFGAVSNKDAFYIFVRMEAT